MRYEWDPKKPESNFIRHGVTFEEATEVFDDPHSIITHLTKND